MNCKQIFAGFIALTVLLVTACAPKPAPAPAETPPAPEIKAPGKEAWEEEWRRPVDAARKEGLVVFYGNVVGEPRTAISEAFRKKYGIRVESVVEASGTAMVAKILAEHRAGLHLADIWIAGGTTGLLKLKPLGLLERLDQMLILPEIKDPSLWYREGLPFLDPPENTVFLFMAYPSGGIAINTNLVKPGEIKSLDDLLHPRWKGKIILGDPTIPGVTGLWVNAIGDKLMGWDYLRELAKQDLNYLGDTRLQMEWLSSGKYPIVITPKTEPFYEYKRAGAPIELLWLPRSMYTTSGGARLSVMTTAPHPNAAKVFSNWLLSKEGITIFSKASGTQSARLDVPTDFLDPARVRNPEISYFNADTLKWRLGEPELYAKSKELFGPFIKK